MSNIVGSFARSMPVTGSFTRTAVNHASGVRTPLGGIFTGALVLAALTLTSTFYFIPKATLAGVIIAAMFYMIEYQEIQVIWRTNSKQNKINNNTKLFQIYRIGYYSLDNYDSRMLIFGPRLRNPNWNYCKPYLRFVQRSATKNDKRGAKCKKFKNSFKFKIKLNSRFLTNK